MLALLPPAKHGFLAETAAIPGGCGTVDVQLRACLPVRSSHCGLCCKGDVTGALPPGLIPVAVAGEAPNGKPGSHHRPDDCALSRAASLTFKWQEEKKKKNLS